MTPNQSIDGLIRDKRNLKLREMKTAIANLRVQENWNGHKHKHKLQQLFTWLTGYEIMFEGSRENLIDETSEKWREPK